MKAVICTNYGPSEVLKIKEIKKPIPKTNEVLIKIHATSAHIGDTRIRRADPFLVRLGFGLLKPKKNLILGLEVSGVIEAVGKNITSFKAGDEVFALTGFGGGYAEYICLPGEAGSGNLEKKGVVALKPVNLTHAQAATVPAAGLTVLKNFQKANIMKGHKILINGASGSLGTYAVQMAKHFGVVVTAVCSGANVELVKSLGADEVIDYTKDDFTQINTRFDIVYDAAMKSKKSHCKKILKSGGVFINNLNLPKTEEDDLIVLKNLIEENKLIPFINRTYYLDEIVEAHRYVDKGHKKGNVAITVV